MKFEGQGREVRSLEVKNDSLSEIQTMLIT